MSGVLSSLQVYLENSHVNRALLHKLPFETSSHPLLPIYLLLLCFSVTLLKTRKQIYLLLRFAYACFLRPLGASALQKDRLDAFYTSQATIYDASRGRLLKGREEMLRLAAAHLESQLAESPQKRGKLVWIDIGGGTGWNIEQMEQYMSLDSFHAVFLIDLCEPLLDIARKRFAAKGWKNVHCLNQDASTFVLPDIGTGAPIQDISLCTMSYSLSMIPTFYAMLDRVERFLHPTEGIVACVDFYVSGRSSDSQTVGNAGDTKRYCNYFNRLFWLHWFEFDHVCLHPSRRNYLEFKFGTIKTINARNTFGPFASIPYYVWLGCKARKDISSRLSVFGADPLTPMLSPTLSATTPSIESMPDLFLSSTPSSPSSIASSPKGKSSTVDIPPDSTGSALSAFYYQKHNYRMPYFHGKDQKQFWSWIYGFTWEDPADDMRRMKISKKDTVMCITSAGDNALHYAIQGRPKRIHCVDMNPCQGHLLELKLAGIHALEYEEFWQLFGEGKHPDFATVLDRKLAPHLSAHAYAFWKTNASAFDVKFYRKGYSGWALRVLSTIFALHGKSAKLEAFANAATLEEQRQLYETSIRPVILSGTFVKLVLSNPIFLWNSLGVPMNQLSIFLNETLLQYCKDTLDPIGRNIHIRSSNYHYYLSLMCRFNPESPPLYLSRAGFAQLKSFQCASLETLRLHTDSLYNAIRSIEQGSLDCWIGMDHMDWFSPTVKVQVDELRECIRAIRKAMPIGGRAFWRSAAITPWYAEIWATEGFRTERLSTRSIGTQAPIDNVNMYASLWRAVRM